MVRKRSKGGLLGAAKAGAAAHTPGAASFVLTMKLQTIKKPSHMRASAEPSTFGLSLSTCSACPETVAVWKA